MADNKTVRVTTILIYSTLTDDIAQIEADFRQAKMQVSRPILQIYG
jgi:hypothetical protein